MLALAILLTITSLVLAPRLKFDRSIENMFPSDSPDLASYQKLKRTFGGNEIVLAVYEDAELFAASGRGLKRLKQIRHRLAEVPGVKAVLSIDQPLPGQMILGDRRLASRTRHLFEGYTHGADNKTVSIVCMLFPEDQTEVPRRETIDRLRYIMTSLPEGLERGWLTGEPIMVVDGFRYVERDGRRLGIWSTLLLGLTIVVCFRSIRWVLIPVLVVQFALLMTQASLVASRIRLSMVSSMLVAVIMVIGVATMVHIMVRYAEFRSQGRPPLDSLRSTFEQLAIPITWACLTDAVGFLALTVSDVGPVYDFGVMMSIGSLMVWVSVMLIVPGLTVLGNFDLDPHRPWGETHLDGQLQRILRGVRRRPVAILLSFAALIGLTMLGIGRLKVETDFTRNFRTNSHIAVAYRFVESRLGGAGVCDVIVPAPDDLRWAYLERVYSLGQELCPREGKSDKFAPITKTFNLADALVELSPVELRGKPAFVQNGLVSSGLTAMRGWMPDFFDAMYGVDPVDGKHYMRLMLRVNERQDADVKRQLIQDLQATARAEFPDAEVTGYFVLLSRLIDSVLKDQWRTFIVAIVGIGILMTIAFRDLRLALIALVPNAFPVLVVLGLMGWLSSWFWPELKINMGTAMIAAVSMGLSIDSSIHYIIGFKEARASGLDFDQALRQAQSRVGKAMVLSTLALAVGFTVLATSDFVPTVYFGSLVTLAMLGGLAGNLIGLPLLIHLFARR